MREKAVGNLPLFFGILAKGKTHRRRKKGEKEERQKERSSKQVHRLDAIDFQARYPPKFSSRGWGKKKKLSFFSSPSISRPPYTSSRPPMACLHRRSASFLACRCLLGHCQMLPISHAAGHVDTQNIGVCVQRRVHGKDIEEFYVQIGLSLVL